MKLQDLDFIRLIPQFMQDDQAVKGLANGLNQLIPDLDAHSKRLSTWDCIDELPESELDALAWELNILWYDYGATIETKRDLVSNSDKVWARIGTKWAVESVIHSYFSDGAVTEWFEYDGKPGTFRIRATVPAITQDKMEAFRNILDKVKRASAHLERMEIDNPPMQTTLYLGGALIPSPVTTQLPQYLPTYDAVPAYPGGVMCSVTTLRLPPMEVTN